MKKRRKHQKIDVEQVRKELADPAFAPPWNRRITVILACAIAFLGVLLTMAGPAWGIVAYRVVIDGGCAVLWVLAAWGLGAVCSPLLGLGPWIEKSKAPEPADVVLLRFVTAAAVGLGIFSLATLLLGLAGWLNRYALLAVPVVGLILGCARSIARPVAEEPAPWLKRRADFAWLWVFTMPLLAMAVIAAMVPAGVLWGDEPNGYDVAEYHLQLPREWLDLRRVVPLHHNVFSFMPLNVEMNYLLAMAARGGPWQGMYLAQLMHVGYCCLFVLAVYAVAGGGRRGTIAAVIAAGVPWLLLLAPVAYDEGGLLLYATLAIGWAMRATTTRDLRSFVLAGLMAGFACGVKYPAVPLVLLALAVAMVFEWIAGRLAPPLPPGPRRVARGFEIQVSPEVESRPHPNPLPAGTRGEGTGARRVPVPLGILLFLVAGSVAVSPWLVRNLVWAHNPVFPEAMHLLGKAHFTDVQVERWERAYLPDPKYRSATGRAEALAREVIVDWRFGFALLPLGAAAAILARRLRGTVLLVVMWLILTVVWCGFTHVQSRFYVMAIPILALLVAQADELVFRWLAAAAGVGMTVLALLIVGGKLAPFLENDRQMYARGSGVGLLGNENLNGLRPLDLATLAPDEHVALVGDAYAFFYQIPTARLHYKTVFDVDTSDPAKTAEEDWLAGEVEPGVKTRIVRDLAELARLAGTYYGFPQVTGKNSSTKDTKEHEEEKR